MEKNIEKTIVKNPNLFILDKVKNVCVEHKISNNDDHKSSFTWDEYKLEFDFGGVSIFLNIKLEPKQRELIKSLGLLSCVEHD